MSTTAASAPPPAEAASRLASRLPAAGPVLLLGELAAELTPRPRRDVTRRALGSEGLVGVPRPASWRTIVLSPDEPLRDWPALLGSLRGTLIEDGKVFVLLPNDGAAVSGAAAAEAVAALLESGFRVVDERVLALDPPRSDKGPDSEGGIDGGPTVERAAGSVAPAVLLIEARPDEHVVRLFREGDESAILDLFAASFASPRGHDHWRWKYRDHPFGTLAISCAFGPNGDLAAHYAAYPVRFRRSRTRIGETILCHQVGDTMTDKRYRHVGRGPTSLLARTARHFYARRCEGRVGFNYGFNTGNIQRFSQLFVGARKVWDVELWSSSVAGLRLAGSRLGLRRYRASRVKRLDARFDDLFEHAAPDHGLIVERRRPYLEWRYLRCPDRDYHLLRVDLGSRLVGWGVFRADGGRLLWGDALFDPEHPGAVSALLRAASGIDAPEAGERAREASGAPDSSAESEGRIEGWFSRHPPWWTEWLTALGFVAKPEPQGLGMVFVPFLECPDEELANEYYLTMGDSDLF